MIRSELLNQCNCIAPDMISNAPVWTVSWPHDPARIISPHSLVEMEQRLLERWFHSQVIEKYWNNILWATKYCHQICLTDDVSTLFSVPTNEECRAWQGRTKMWSKRQDMCLGLNLCCASAMSRSNDFSDACQMVRWECVFHNDCAQQPWRLPPSGQVHLHWLHQQDLQHGG